MPPLQELVVEEDEKAGDGKEQISLGSSSIGVHVDAAGTASPYRRGPYKSDGCMSPRRVALWAQRQKRGNAGREAAMAARSQKQAAIRMQCWFRQRQARALLKARRDEKAAWDNYSGYPTPVNAPVPDLAWASTCLLEHPTAGPVGSGVVVDGSQFWGLVGSRCLLTTMHGAHAAGCLAAASMFFFFFFSNCTA